MIGVYQITCRSNGKRYIGSAFDIASRWTGHRCDLRARRHCNRKLQNAWNKYGEADFTFETLLECSEVDRLSNEQFFLDFFRAVSTGFNICPIAGTRRGSAQPEGLGARVSVKLKGRKRSPETIKRMRTAQRNRSPQWKRRISESKKKLNGATRAPMAVGRRQNMAREQEFTQATRKKMSVAAYAREARKREEKNGIIF